MRRAPLPGGDHGTALGQLRRGLRLPRLRDRWDLIVNHAAQVDLARIDRLNPTVLRSLAQDVLIYV